MITERTPPPGLAGSALQAWLHGEARRQAEARQAAEHQAVIRYMLWLGSHITGQSAPDAARAALGREDALRVLSAAGLDTEAIADAWLASDAPQQVSSAIGEQYAGDPTHDPRVTGVLTRPGATMDEIQAAIAEVTAEHAGRKAAAARKAAETRPAPQVPMGVSTDAAGYPVQTSTVMQKWDEFPDHAPGFMAQALAPRWTPPSALPPPEPPPPPQVPGCACGGDHARQAGEGHRWCDQCGADLAVAERAGAVA